MLVVITVELGRTCKEAEVKIITMETIVFLEIATEQAITIGDSTAEETFLVDMNVPSVEIRQRLDLYLD